MRAGCTKCFRLSLAELLMQEQDGLLELRRKAEKAMLAEARRHRARRLVKRRPGLGGSGRPTFM